MESHALQIAVIGSVVLLLVGLLRKLPCAEIRSPKLTLTAFFCGLLLGMLAIHSGLRISGYRPDTAVVRLGHQNSVKAQRAVRDAVQNILIVEGGSHAARGIDPDLLEAKLADHGYTVSVISFAIPGANHLERFALLSEFARGVDFSDERHGVETNIVLLREVNRRYDERPLEQFRENLFTDRSISYLDSGNFPLAIRALFAAPKVDADAPQASTAYRITQHGLINLFNVGALTRMKKSDQQGPRVSDFHSLTNRKEGFVFSGIDALLQNRKAEESEQWIRHRDWKKRLIDEPLIETLEPDHLIFFAVPTLRKGTLQYLDSYADDHPYAALLSFRDQDELLRDLNTAAAWYDTGHLAAPGSEIYTSWLAAELGESGAFEQR